MIIKTYEKNSQFTFASSKLAAEEEAKYVQS